MHGYCCSCMAFLISKSQPHGNSMHNRSTSTLHVDMVNVLKLGDNIELRVGNITDAWMPSAPCSPPHASSGRRRACSHARHADMNVPEALADDETHLRMVFDWRMFRSPSTYLKKQETGLHSGSFA